jgi:hypothetical protein
MHAVNKSTVETLVKQTLLGKGRINTQQWAAHATIELVKEVSIRQRSGSS